MAETFESRRADDEAAAAIAAERIAIGGAPITTKMAPIVSLGPAGKDRSELPA